MSVPSASGHEPGGQRRGVAAARAARDAVRVPRVDDVAEVRVLARHAPGELVGVGLADDDRALGLERRDGRRGATRDVVGEDRRRVGRPHARGVDEVLDEQRHARQAARHPGARPGQGRLGAERDHRAEVGGGLEPRQRRRDGLLGAERARPDRGGDLGGGHAPSRATASTSSRAPGTTSRGDLDERAGRAGVAEERLPGRVDPRAVVDVHHEDRHLDDVGRRARRRPPGRGPRSAKTCSACAADVVAADEVAPSASTGTMPETNSRSPAAHGVGVVAEGLGAARGRAARCGSSRRRPDLGQRLARRDRLGVDAQLEQGGAAGGRAPRRARAAKSSVRSTTAPCAPKARA